MDTEILDKKKTGIFDELLKDCIKPTCDKMKVEQELNKYQKCYERLWPIEQDVEDALEGKIKILKSELEINGKYGNISQKYKRIQLKDFMVSHTPRFAIYSLNNNECSIRLEHSDTECNPAIFLNYINVKYWQSLMKKQSARRLYASVKFNGCIPEKVKNNIKQAQSIFGNNIYIVAEVEDWETQILKKDPLVIGILENSEWLIDRFDTTSLEDYLCSEFII